MNESPPHPAGSTPGPAASPGVPPPGRIRPGAAGPDWTTRTLLRWMAERFEAADLEMPRLVAEMLLAHVLECDRMRLYMEADRPASADELARLRELVRRAGAREPVQYLTGSAGFFGRDFLVDRSTLIPQPCTEELVALAIRFLRPERASVFDRFDLQRLDALLESARGGEAATEADETPSPTGAADDPDEAGTEAAAEAEPSGAPPAGPLVADLGTGSGCIAISVALAVPSARIIATDIAEEALDLARRNADRFGVADRIEFLAGDLLEPLTDRCEPGTVDVLLSNPPYVPDTEWDGGLVEPSVREHVPARALRGGPDGTDLIRPLLRGAPQWLRPGGLLAVECASAHAEQVLAWAGMHPRLERPELLRDGDDLPRIVTARRPQST